jgi:hypothetical protein
MNAKVLAKLLLAVPDGQIGASELTNYITVDDEHGNAIGVDFNQGTIYIDADHPRAKILEGTCKILGITKFRQRPEEQIHETK